MIVSRPAPERLRIVTQPDHAHLASRLMELWRADGLPDHPRREELLFAIREHDNGWWEADSAPRLDPATGRPLGFREVPAALRREIWERGSERHAEGHPYAALLVTRHAQALHADRAGGAEWREFLSGLEERRRELAEAVAPRDQEIDRDYGWLRLADSLSLALCEGRHGPVECPHPSVVGHGDTLTLDPFPYAGRTTFELSCRDIPDRRYSGHLDLAEELGAARWQRILVRVAPAPPTAEGTPG